VRSGHECVGQALLRDRLHAHLVRGVHVGVQQHDRDRGYARRVEPVAGRVHARLVERDVDLAFGGECRSPHLEAQRALDERHVLSEIEVVRVGAVDCARIS